MKLKDKKISIMQMLDGGYDDYGFWVDGAWTPIHEGQLWAYYRQLSGKEINAAGLSGIVEEDAVFTINWRADVAQNMIVKFRGRYYDIVRIDEYEGYKNDLDLYCKYNDVRLSEVEGGGEETEEDTSW